MREIKFRLRRGITVVGYEKWYPGSWSKEYDYWIAEPRWLYSKDGNTWSPYRLTGKYASKDQFIGLQDKNGKEIYEGDIVLFPDGGADILFKVCFGGLYEDTGYGITAKNAGGLPDAPIDSWDRINPRYAKKIEVIGNIYENPDIYKDIVY